MDASVVVIDDDQITVEWVRGKLADVANLRIVAEFSDGQSGLNFLRKNAASLVILDLGIRGGMHGLEAGPLIRAANPACKILVLSQFDNYYPMVENWADGYLFKREAPAKLILAVRQVLAGVPYVSDQVRAAANPEAFALFHSLSPREVAVVELAVKGKRRQEIAAELGVSETTVNKHLQNTYDRLKLTGPNRTKAGLIDLARAAGLIRPYE